MGIHGKSIKMHTSSDYVFFIVCILINYATNTIQEKTENSESILKEEKKNGNDGNNGSDGSGEIVDEFEQYLINNKSLMNELNDLDNYTEIGCWCKPKGCHGDIILNQYNKYQTI